MRVYTISKDETSLIKGFAILLITLHNYFHWISPSPGENEFDFNPDRIFNLFHDIADFPTECINILFSYFGHFGVQLFIFISGYGLTLSFIKNPRSWGGFLVNRLKKIYPLILTGIVFLFIFDLLAYQEFITNITWKELAYKCLFIHTLLPESGLRVIGPWWFFGLIVQLYILFPFLFRLLKKNPTIWFCILCILAYGAVFVSQYFFQDLKDTPFLENAPGHMPEFCLGIWFALKKGATIPNILFPLALIVFILGNFFHIAYPFTFLSVTLLFIVIHPYILKYITNKSNDNNTQIIQYQYGVFPSFVSKIGNLSMLIFVIHAPIRDVYTQIFDPVHNAFITLLGAVAYILTYWCIAYGIKGLYTTFVHIFSHIPTPLSQKETLIEKILIVLLFLWFSYVVSYYVKTSKFSHDSILVKPTLTMTSDTIQTSENYYNLTKYRFDSNPQTYIVKIALDYQSLNGASPSVILSIGAILWEQFKIENTTDTCFTHYEFSYQYHRPVIQRLKDKELSIFLWTHNKVEGMYRNVNITIEEY